MIKRTKTRQIPKSEYVIYLNKAEEFFEMMQQAYQQRMWTAVGLNAVHCAISSCDALLVFFQGIRCSGDNHLQVVDLLSQTAIVGIKKNTATVRRIIAKKNVIAYENREFRERDASEICKQVERFYIWVFDYLNKNAI